MTMFDIHIKPISLYYKKQLLFSHLSLELPAKKWICLLGKSGVGKTTVLRLIAALTTKDCQITTVGNDNPSYDDIIAWQNGKSLSKQIAYMAQGDDLCPWLSALNNVMLPYRLQGEKITDQLKKRAILLFEQAGLDQAMNLKPRQLSGGMKKRVAVIRTLLLDKPLMLMDEPFSALDTITRYDLYPLAIDLLKGKTVLLVTHDPLEALYLGDIIYVMAGTPAILHPFNMATIAKPRQLNDSLLLKAQATLLAFIRQINNSPTL